MQAQQSQCSSSLFWLCSSRGRPWHSSREASAATGATINELRSFPQPMGEVRRVARLLGRQTTGRTDSGVEVVPCRCCLQRTATLSLSALEDVTSLSRPMLIRGSEILRERELIIKGLSGQTSTYRLTPAGCRYYFPSEDDELRPTWAKVPQDIIERVLRDIPNRGRIPLASLRLYILLLTMRNNDTSVANISYRKFQTTPAFASLIFRKAFRFS